MRKFFRLVIIGPALVAVILSGWGFAKFRERQRLQATLKQAFASTVSSGPLPAGSLIHLETSADYFETVKNGRVLLVFLTTDCGPCNKEARTMTQTLSKLPSQLRVYGVFFEDRNKVAAFAQANPVKFPVLLDKGGLIFNKLHLRHFPAKILMENGNIIKTWVGSSPDEESFLKEVG